MFDRVLNMPLNTSNRIVLKCNEIETAKMINKNVYEFYKLVRQVEFSISIYYECKLLLTAWYHMGLLVNHCIIFSFNEANN